MAYVESGREEGQGMLVNRYAAVVLLPLHLVSVIQAIEIDSEVQVRYQTRIMIG